MSPDDKTKLPWTALSQPEGEVPWDALHSIARALADDPSLLTDLKTCYEAFCDRLDSSEADSYEGVYVPAIVVLAARQMDAEKQRKAAHFLIELFKKAGADQDQFLMEVLFEACVNLGPVVLYDILDTLQGKPNPEGEWYPLWQLTELAEDADPFLRKRIVEFCNETLKKALENELEDYQVTGAAWTLVRLKEKASRSLIQQLLDQTDFPDFEEALAVMDGGESLLHDEKLQQTQPETWVVDFREDLREMYEEAAYDNWDTRTPEEFEAERSRIRNLVNRFSKSPEVQALPNAEQNVAPSVAGYLLDFAWEYEGLKVENLDMDALKTILLEDFPVRVLEDEVFFKNVVPATQMFLKWLAEQNLISTQNAERWSKAIAKWKKKIVPNPLAESFEAIENAILQDAADAGVDISDQRALENYLKRRLEGMLSMDDTELGRHLGLFPKSEEPKDIPPLKISPNSPCPCGSGKKYKNCCGRKR